MSWSSADLLTDSTRTGTPSSSHKVLNEVSQGLLSGKAQTIPIWVNSHPTDQVGLIHAGPGEQLLGEHTLTEVDTELGTVLPVMGASSESSSGQLSRPCLGVSCLRQHLPTFPAHGT